MLPYHSTTLSGPQPNPVIRGAHQTVQSGHHFLVGRGQSGPARDARYTRHNQGRLRAHTQTPLYFDSFSSEEASRTGALSLSLTLPSTLAVSLGLSHAKPFNQKPLQHGTMSKKKKEWRAEKGERLLGSAHFRLANALLPLWKHGHGWLAVSFPAWHTCVRNSLLLPVYVYTGANIVLGEGCQLLARDMDGWTLSCTPFVYF